MPRKKSDNVTEHRVTLGDWERKHVQGQLLGKSIKDIGTGVGIAAVGVGGTYVAYEIGKSIWGWQDNLGEKILTTIGVKPEDAQAFADSNVLSENAPTINPLYGWVLRNIGL